MDAVAAAAVDVSLCVALDAVGDADFCVGEEPTVAEEWLAVVVLDVKGVAIIISSAAREREGGTYMDDGLVKRHAPLP